MNRYNKVYVNPIGTPGTENVDNTNNAGRWSNDQYSALMDQMGKLPLGDPRVMELYMQAVQIWADELPDIPLVQTPSLLIFNTTYWTGWPTADNNYVQPPSHWEHFLQRAGHDYSPLSRASGRIEPCSRPRRDAHYGVAPSAWSPVS